MTLLVWVLVCTCVTYISAESILLPYSSPLRGESIGQNTVFSPRASPVIPNGFVLVDDMVLPKSTGKDGPQFFHTTGLWPQPFLGQSIPYDLTTANYDASYQALIHTALNYISQKTCIAFKSRTTETTGYISFSQSDTTRCFSYVGYMSTSATTVNISPGANCHFGQIVHEVGHALGLYHTHQRPDRDRYVYIDYSKVPSSDVKDNYNTITSGYTLINPYDYGSVMQYPAEPYGNGITFYAPQAVGQRYGYSDFDIQELTFMYTGCKSPAIMCAHSAGNGISAGVGQSVQVNFTVNLYPAGQSTVSPTLPAGAVSAVSSGSNVSSLTTVVVTFTPTSAQKYNQVPITITFTATNNSTLTATCTAKVLVTPTTTPTNCFGKLATNATVCSGHGTCVLTDTCKCSSGYGGLNCQITLTTSSTSGYDSYYNGIPSKLTPAMGWVNDMWYEEDWSMDYVEANVQSFQLKAIQIPIAAQNSSTFLWQLKNYDGTLIVNETRSITASKNLGQASTQVWIFSGGELNVIPRRGRLAVHIGGGGYWNHGAAQMNAGFDNTSFGSAAPSRLYFQLWGYLRCKDGYYGPKCESTCLTNASLPAASQCSWNGLCYDGTTGDGTCRCFSNTSNTSSTCAVGGATAAVSDAAGISNSANQLPGELLPTTAAPDPIVLPGPTAATFTKAASQGNSSKGNSGLVVGVAIGAAVGGVLLLAAAVAMVIVRARCAAKSAQDACPEVTAPHAAAAGPQVAQPVCGIPVVTVGDVELQGVHESYDYGNSAQTPVSSPYALSLQHPQSQQPPQHSPAIVIGF